MFHIEAWEEQYGKGVGSQSGEQHVGVHEKCMGCGVVLPGNLPRYHKSTGLYETSDDWHQSDDPTVSRTVSLCHGKSVRHPHPSII